MAFREKSAWIMTLALLLGGAFYLKLLVGQSQAVGALAPPVIPGLVAFTLILIVIAIAGHIAVAALAPREANASADERERQIVQRAGNISGAVFGAGVVFSLGIYLLTYSGDILFYCCFASLMLGELTDNVLRIVHFRTSI